MRMGPKRKPTYARLDVFARGMTWGMHLVAASHDEITQKVKKEDGSPVGVTAVKEVIAHMKEDPGWRGADTGAGNRGRPSLLTEEDQQEIEDVVFEYKAKAVVTIKFIQKTD